MCRGVGRSTSSLSSEISGVLASPRASLLHFDFEEVCCWFREICSAGTRWVCTCAPSTSTCDFSAYTIFVTSSERNCCCSAENRGDVADCFNFFCTRFLFLPTLVFGSWEPADAIDNSVLDVDCVPSSTSVRVSFQWFHNLTAFSSFVPVSTRLRLFNSSSSVSPDKAKYSWSDRPEREVAVHLFCGIIEIDKYCTVCVNYRSLTRQQTRHYVRHTLPYTLLHTTVIIVLTSS